MTLIEQYIEFNGKHPKGYKDPEPGQMERKYFPEVNPKWKSYGCSYGSEFLKVDIDDFNHDTEQIEEPIKDNPRSDAIVALLDALNIRYNGIDTDHGKHLFFRKPEALEEKNKLNWYCPLGVKMEWKLPTSDDHIPLQINGKKRKFFKGSLDNTDVDELPFFLFPLQKGKTKPFDLDFPSGDRTQRIGAYLFYLIKKGYSAEQAFQIVELMNSYVFSDPIPEETLKAEILNEKTLNKLTESQKDKTPSYSEVANEVAEHFQIKTVNGLMYCYHDGVYVPFDESRITAYLTTMKPKLKQRDENEVVRHIKGITRAEIPENDNTVNVRNGILVFENGDFKFEDHSPERISFKQFNAIFNPAADDALLKETLFNWFDEKPEQIELFKQVVGYLMMNHVKYQKVFFFQGQASTGKSTLLNLITTFCGKDNVSAIQFSDMKKEHGLSSIVNKTANIFADTKPEKVIASDVFKMLADGSLIQINPKFHQPFMYRFLGKMFFAMNEFPDFSEDPHGIKRRVIIFKFKRVFNQKIKGFDPDLLEKLVSDDSLSTLLNMAIQGYKSLIENNGFIETEESRKNSEEFAESNDNILQWLKEAEVDEDYLLRNPINYNTKGIYLDYKAFCFAAGLEPKPQKSFTTRIKEEFELKSKQVRSKQNPNERYQMFYR